MWYIVLLTLALLKQPKYGNAFVQEMEELDISIDQSTFYPLLRRLESQQISNSSWMLKQQSQENAMF